MARKKPTLAVDLDDLGRPVRPTVPDPRKIGTRLDHRILLQVPSVAPSKIRYTAVPRRGSR
jgi:hypothetical protein